jgi:hypothetical protein
VPDAPLEPANVLVRFPDSALSHVTAAARLGIEVPLVPEDALPALSVPRSHGHVRLSGWDVHRVALGSDVVVLDDGFRVTNAARTVADLARRLSTGQAVAAGDSALRQGLVAPDDLRRALGLQRGAGSARCRGLADLLDPASGSVLESLLRVLLVSEGFPRPETQYEVRVAGRLVGRVDFCWPAQRLVVEADGFEFHSNRSQYRRDRHRLNQLESLGWRVLRFSWEDVVHRPSYVVALMQTCLGLAA